MLRRVAHLREIALAVAYQQACLATSSITYDHKLFRVSGWLRDIGSRRYPVRRARSAHGAVAVWCALLSDWFAMK